MSRSKKPRLPEFRSAEAFGRFVETHDMADYWDELGECDPIELSPALKHKIDREAQRMKLVALRLPPGQVQLAKASARRNGIPYSTQLRVWLTRGMTQELASKRRASG